MKERIHWIDICRAWAIFAIVFGHVIREGALREYVMSFHVPLFFMLSGLVFSHGGKGFVPFLKKRAYAILLPYFIWAVISCGVYAVLGSFAAGMLGVDTGDAVGFFRPLLGFIYGNESVFAMTANLPLWFLPCLFAEYMLMYPVKKYLPERYLPMAAMICFALGCINVGIVHISGLPFNIENTVFMSGFFVLGMYLGTTPLLHDSSGKKTLTAIPAVLLIAAGAVLSQMNGHIDYNWMGYGNCMVYVISALCGCFGYIVVCRLLPPQRAVETIGASTLAILVMHKFPVLFFQTAVPYVKSLLASGSIICSVAVSAAVIALCMAVKLTVGKKLSFMM